MDKLLFGNDDLIQELKQIKPMVIKLKVSTSPCLYYRSGICLMCEKCTLANKFIDKDGIQRCKVSGDSRIGLLIK